MFEFICYYQSIHTAEFVQPYQKHQVNLPSTALLFDVDDIQAALKGEVMIPENILTGNDDDLHQWLMEIA